MDNIIKFPGKMFSDYSVIKAFFKDYPLTERKKFKNSKCILPINIGQAIHEGNKLKTTISLINQFFKQCSILLDDTIQKYIFAIYTNKNVKDLLAFCKDEGDRWINRNIETIRDTFTIPYTVIRWGDWTNHHKFSYFYKKITNLYKNNSEYKKSIELNTNRFLDYITERGIVFDRKKGIFLYKKYLKEKSAVTCLWTDEGFEFEISPTKSTPCTTPIYEKIIKYDHPNFLRTEPVYLQYTQVKDKENLKYNNL